MEFALLILLAIGAAVLLMYRSGNADFWKVASRYPDQALDWFKSDPAWVVIDGEGGQPPTPRNEYAGPFFLWVPKLGNRRITLYGRHGAIENSQREFMNRFRQVG